MQWCYFENQQGPFKCNKGTWSPWFDSVIQATGTLEFEDGLWIENHIKAHKACTIPGGTTRSNVKTQIPPKAD